jgi:hypothetical protein
MRIEFPAELAGTAGARVEASYDGCINVFHESAPRDELTQDNLPQDKLGFLAHTAVYICTLTQA